ncbi:MAG TPA: hypothetical protein VIL04_05580 [Solirubrobacterales bacterium]|jgi:fatty acid desaturase
MAAWPQRASVPELGSLERRHRMLVRAIELALLFAALAVLLLAAAAILVSPALVTLATIVAALAIATVGFGIRAAVHRRPDGQHRG